jgi:hypothetical protein
VITVVCWKWRPPRGGYRSHFTAAHVNVLRAMIGRNLHMEHSFVCVTDHPDGIDPRVRIVPLWDDYAEIPSPWGAGNPSCYRRLKAFSRDAAALLGERIFSIDLDVVITGDITPLVDRPEDFVIWGDTAPGTPYNGGMWLLRAGTRPQVWEDFDPVKSPPKGRALGYVGSDQAWIGACLGPHEAKWGTADGVYSWRVHIKRARYKLPGDARVVHFHGQQDPWSPAVLMVAPWIRKHWHARPP